MDVMDRGRAHAGGNGGSGGNGGPGAGGNNRRPEIDRGPGGAKKHTPGQDTKSGAKRKAKDAERRVGLQNEKDAQLAAQREAFDKLSPDVQKLVGGFEKYVQDQKNKQK